MLRRWKPVESIDALGGDGVIAGELSGDPEVPNGLLTVNGVPTSREIEVRDRKTRRVVSVRRSNTDGTYRFPGLNPALQYDVIARDFAGDYEDVIAGAVRPHTPDLLVPVAAGDKMAAFADPYWADVVSLLHFDGADGSTTFTDEKGVTWSASGGAQLDTGDSRFGASSLLLASANDEIYSGDISAFGFGNGDFTLELLVKTSASGAESVLFDLREGTATTAGSFFISTGRKLALWTGSLIGDTGSTVPSNTWTHIAFARGSGTLRAFIDGVQQWSVSNSSDFTTSRSCRIGGSAFGSLDNLSGHIDEVRITKGVARYTANFTPPTAPFEL